MKIETKLIVAFALIGIMLFALVEIVAPPPAALIIAEVKGYKDFRVQNGEVQGYWWLTAAVNFPPGSIRLALAAEELDWTLPSGQKLTTERDMEITFNSVRPFYRGAASKLTYLYRQYDTKFVWFPPHDEACHWDVNWFVWKVTYWRDAGVPYDINLKVDGKSVDSEKVLVGGKWGSDVYTLSDDDGNELRAYNLGWLNRGMVPPTEKYVIFWSPSGTMKVATAEAWDLHMKQIPVNVGGYVPVTGTLYEKMWCARGKEWATGYPTWGDIYTNLGLASVPTVSSADWVATWLEQYAPDASSVLALDEITRDPVTPIRFIDWHYCSYHGRNVPACGGVTGTGIFSTGYSAIYRQPLGSVNVLVTFEIEAGLVDTIIWVEPQGEAFIDSLIDPVKFTDVEGYGTQQVKIKNIGTGPDDFRGKITFGSSGWSYEIVEGLVSLAPNSSGTLSFRIYGPSVSPDETKSTIATVHIWPVLRPADAVTKTFTVSITGESEPVPGRGAVTGVVRDTETKEGIADVSVRGSGGTPTLTAAETGIFTIYNVWEGSGHTLEFIKLGYDTKQVVVPNVIANDTVDIGEVLMHKSGVGDWWSEYGVYVIVGIVIALIAIGGVWLWRRT